MRYLILALAFYCVSCSPTKELNPSGLYPQTPMIFNSDKSFDVTWDKLVDIFAQKGLTIKLIDRSSGLIVSQKSLLEATIENRYFKPVDPTAYVVIPSISWNGKRIPVSGTNVGPYATEKQIRARPVYGDWNVRIKANGSGSTINVNINNLQYEDYNSVAKMNTLTSINSFKSTGVFENQLAEILK